MEKEKNDFNDNGEKQPDNSNDLNNFVDIDVVDAYYKQRLSKSSSSSIFKAIESDSDSSLGVLDIDNVSVLDEMDNQIMTHDRFSFLTQKNSNGNYQELDLRIGPSSDINNPYIFKTEPLKSELNLIKQRELAKKTLLQLSNKLELINKNLNSLEIDKVNKKPEETETGKKSLVNELLSRGNKFNWLNENQSPQTPKFFRDELNSITESSHTPGAWMKDLKSKSSNPQKNICPTTNTTSNDAMASEDSNFRVSSLTFESKDPADILNRFEEDEKRFIKEQSALSNNSKISQFSGIEGGELVHPEIKDSSEQERISIGKYFELRSHSINSLVGEKGPGDFEPIREIPELIGLNAEGTASQTLMQPTTQDVPTENDEMNEARIQEDLSLDQRKIKRWNSFEYNSLLEAAIERQSNESSGSTSTLLIQNLLCGMDSGLSGTEINDRLLECLGKIKNENKEKMENVNSVENMETPKSSKTLVKSGNFRKPKGKSERNVSVAELAKKCTKSSLERKRSISKSCSEMHSNEFKDNVDKLSQIRSRADKKILSLRNEYITDNNVKGFESSTPKLENIRSNSERFRSDCNKLRISDKDWEPPRVSSLRKSINLSGSLSLGECEKTLIVDCSVTSSGNKKNTNTDIQGTFTIEDTIADGDLTIVSERISKMQEESVCVLRSPCKQKDILTVVQELAKYPKGSVDCSALTPLLRDQYPELLSTFSFNADQTMTGNDARELKLTVNEPTITSPGSWVNFPSNYGSSKNIFRAVEHLKKVIFKPIRNLTKDWLIVSLESIGVEYQTEKYLNGTKMNNGFYAEDLLFASMKDTLVPPDELCSLKICLTPRVAVTVNVKLEFIIKKLTDKQTQTEEILICIVGSSLQDNISIIPTHGIDFGLIPEECHEKKTVQIRFEGTNDLPVRIYTDKPQNFVLSPEVVVNGESMKDCVWKENELFYKFEQGSRRISELEVLFQPREALKGPKNAQVSLNGALSVVLDSPENNGLIRKIPLCGRVGFAKFLCNPSCSPFIFRTSEIGKSVKRSFPLKNVGAIGIEFSLSVVCENSHEEVKDDLFIVPKTFFLPKDEESAFDIVFSGKTKENYVRRYLLFQMKPNGRIFYDIELIGVVMPVQGGKSVSSSSYRSGPTHSIYNTGNIAFKLMSTTQSLSWAAVPLDVELKQTFHIMNSSSCNAVARFAFRKERSAFRFMNENGELIEKLKKVLKPNCSNIMTVVFRPDALGPHNNSIIIETNRLTGRKMISVNGYGGCPKIFIRNLKSDLNGSKIIRLVSSECGSQNFRASIEFINKGNVSGFVSIKTIVKVLSLSSGVEVEPSNFVLLPNSKISVQISQILKNDDIKRLLSGRDIGKLATVTVTTGDEPSRFRLRKLIREQGMKTSESISFLMSEFNGEIGQDIDKFDDDKHFESIFRRNLETTEIAVIIERPMDVCESTIFEDFEETVKEFVTILPAADCSVRSSRGFEQSNPIPSKEYNLEKSNLSASSRESSNSHDKKIKKWLATLERP